MLPTWAEDNHGNVYINDFKRYVKGVALVPPQRQNPLTVAAAPGPNLWTQSPPIIIEGGEDSVGESFSLIGAHDDSVATDVRSRATVEITDKAYRRRYMNRPILVDHCFGTPLNPFFLNETIMIEGQQVLEFVFYNNSQVGEWIWRYQLESRKFQAVAMTNEDITKEIGKLRQRKPYLNPFWLTSEQAVEIPASGVRDIFFRNTRDNFLILQYLMGRTIMTGQQGDTQEVIEIELFDAKTDRPLQNVPFTLNTGTGTATFPFVLPAPLFVEPVNRIRARVRNLIMDQPTEVFLTFHGVAIFVSDQNPWLNQTVDKPATQLYYHGAP